MVLPGQPVPGQKIARTRMEGVDDGAGGTPVDRTGAAPDAVAFMAAYSEARDGEGRTRSRSSPAEQEAERTDIGGEGATPATAPAVEQVSPRPGAGSGPVRKSGAPPVARYFGDPGKERVPRADVSMSLRPNPSADTDGKAAPASIAQRPSVQSVPATKGEDRPVAPASGDPLPATEAQGDAPPPQTAQKTQKAAATLSLHDKADLGPSGPAGGQGATSARGGPDTPTVASAKADPPTGPVAHMEKAAAMEPAGRAGSPEAPQRAEPVVGAGVRSNGWRGQEAGSTRPIDAKGQATGVQRRALPPETPRAQAAPPAPAEPIGKPAQAPGIAAHPGVPGQGATHPGQHALDQAPGAAARANGQGVGIGLVSAQPGTGENAFDSVPGPRGAITPETAVTADRPRLDQINAAQPPGAEDGRTTPPPAREVASDPAPRLGLDTPARIDGSPAQAAAAAGPVLPEGGATTPHPPPTAATAAAVAEIPGAVASEASSQTLSGSASVAGPAASSSGQTGMATSPGTPQAMAQTAANQIVASLPRPLSELGTGPLEVALDPPELGRVRLSLVEVAGAMTLSITAERPETAELMRRHLDLLAQEFTRSGLDAPSVRVGTEGGGAQGQGPGADGETGARAPAGSGLPEAETRPALQPAPAPDPRRALDLRL